MRVAKWTGILGFVMILLASPLTVAAQVPVAPPRAAASAPLALVPAPGSPFMASPGADTVLAGDLNRDGKGDLVVGDRYTQHGAVFFGRGDGSFTPAPVPPVAMQGTTTLTDVSGDGVLDLVLVCGGGVSVQRGRGDGTFTATGATIDGTCGRAFFLADLDRDGVRDVISGAATAPRTYTPITRYRGYGDGTFAPPVVVAPPGILRAVQDLDGDGTPDLYTTYPNGPNPGAEFTYRGNGDGTFTTADLPAPPFVEGLRADVDGDGVPDRVGIVAGEVTVARGVGIEVFAPPVTAYAFTICSCSVYVLGDTNGDGATDLGLTDYVSGRITVLVLPRATALPAARTAPALAAVNVPAPVSPARPVLPTVAPQPVPRAMPPASSPPPVSVPEAPRPLPPRR